MIFKKLHHIFPKYRQLLQTYTKIHTYIYKMDKAYMRSIQGTDTFEFSFQYFNTETKVNRQFNFSRQLTEPVGSFLSRVCTNVGKAINKKQKKRKGVQDENLIIEPEIKLLQNGTEVRPEILCEDLFKSSQEIKLKIDDHEFTICINTPWIINIALPLSILANYPVYPTKFETMFAAKEFSQFLWSKSSDRNSWKHCGTGFLYTPNSDDINCYLKLNCLPKNENDFGPEVETISKGVVEAGPGQSPFELRHYFTKEKLSGRNFRIVTYNILADLYTDSDYSRTELFPYCPPYALHIDYRKQLILKELIGYNADIICLQETDAKVFDNDLKPVLSTFNFDGIYHRKGTIHEGLACFYNNTRFKLLDSKSIMLGENLDTNPIFEEYWSKISKNENLVKRFLERNTTLQITILESIENNEILLVANTHFYFHPDADHIRLLQGGFASIYIEDTIKQFKTNGKRLSVIYCGDFNSVPECGIYKLYTTGFVDENFIDWSSNTEEAVKEVNFTQNRLYASACGTPKYTNFTVLFRDCLDYIYYEKNNFEVTQVVPMLSDEELTAHSALPSVVMPSDHIALIADLKLL